MAGPEVAALQVSPQLSSSCLRLLRLSIFILSYSLPQSLLSSVSQLCHSFGAKVDWLEQEVSTLRSHVMALRSELQDVCEGDSGAFVLVSLIELAVEMSFCVLTSPQLCVLLTVFLQTKRVTLTCSVIF